MNYNKKNNNIPQFLIAMICSLMLFTACGGSDESKKTHIKVDYTQLEKEANEAAYEVLDAVASADSMAMENAILNMKSIESEYRLMDDKMAVDAFREKFEQKIASENEVLAEELFDYKKK